MSLSLSGKLLTSCQQVHVILDHYHYHYHYPQYFGKFSKHLYETHMEHTESMHGKTKNYEKKHGYINVIKT